MPLLGHAARECGDGLGFRPYCPLDPVSAQQGGSQAFFQTNRRRMLTITLPTILHGPAGGEVPVKAFSAFPT